MHAGGDKQCSVCMAKYILISSNKRDNRVFLITLKSSKKESQLATIISRPDSSSHDACMHAWETKKNQRDSAEEDRTRESETICPSPVKRKRSIIRTYQEP